MPYHLSHLKKLNSAATAGEWKPIGVGRCFVKGSDGFLVADTLAGSTRTRDERVANAELIATVRTHLPEIIKDLEELERMRGLLTTPTTSRDPSA